MADTATFSGAMMSKLIPGIRDTLPKGMVLLFGSQEANPTDFKGILPSAEGIDFVGNEFRIPQKTRRNQAVGFRNEGEYLPAPLSSTYSYITEPLRYAYALFNITGPLLAASEAGQGAWVPAFKQEMSDTLLASKLDMNMAAFNDGTGRMATYVSGAPGTAIVVDTTVNFRGGEIVDFASTAGAFGSANNAAVTILAVNRTTKTLTTDKTVTTPGASDGLFRASADSTNTVPNNSQNRAVNGLQNIISATGTLHGFNPSTYPFWASYVKAINGPVSDAVLRDAKDAVGFEQGLDLNSGLDFAIITTRGIRRRYADTLTSLKRFNDAQSVTLHGGFTVLMFDENPIFVDDTCPVGNIFGVALNKLFWAQGSDWSWMQRDGDVLKWESRRDRYVAILYKYCNLGTSQRGAHFRLTGLSDDSR